MLSDDCRRSLYYVRPACAGLPTRTAANVMRAACGGYLVKRAWRRRRRLEQTQPTPYSHRARTVIGPAAAGATGGAKGRAAHGPSRHRGRRRPVANPPRAELLMAAQSYLWTRRQPPFPRRGGQPGGAFVAGGCPRHHSGLEPLLAYQRPAASGLRLARKLLATLGPGQRATPSVIPRPRVPVAFIDQPIRSTQHNVQRSHPARRGRDFPPSHRGRSEMPLEEDRRTVLLRRRGWLCKGYHDAERAMYEEMMPAVEWLRLGWREICRLTLAACAGASGPQRRRWSKRASVALAFRKQVRDINLILGVHPADLASHDHWLWAVTEPLAAALGSPSPWGNEERPGQGEWQRPKKACHAPPRLLRRPFCAAAEEDEEDEEDGPPVTSSPAAPPPGSEPSVQTSWEDIWAKRRLQLIEDLVQQTVQLYHTSSSCPPSAVLGLTSSLAHSLLVLRSWSSELSAFSVDGSLPLARAGLGPPVPLKRLLRARRLWARLLDELGAVTPEQQAAHNLLSGCMPLILRESSPAPAAVARPRPDKLWDDLYARLCALADEPLSGVGGAAPTRLEAARAAAKASMALFIRTLCPGNLEYQAGNGEVMVLLSALLPVRPVLTLISETECWPTLVSLHGLARLLVATSDWVLLTNRRLRCLVHLGLCARFRTTHIGEGESRESIHWIDDLVGRRATWPVLFDGRRPPATEAEAKCWMARLFVDHEARAPDPGRLVRAWARRAESYIDDGPFGWVARSIDDGAEEVHMGWVSAVEQRLPADATQKEVAQALAEDVRSRCDLPRVGLIFRRVLENAPRCLRDAGPELAAIDHVSALDRLLVRAARSGRLDPPTLDLLRCGDTQELGPSVKR
ncbi:hypothetical protein CSAL01_13336 [Colletotrichum salicis]|uniref:Uncharacterized protein n=1 Tax=Colletotrichum salicis TaxID=1209931 RepID=A0A135UL29_9PEZI|nr:hypothetical protein CSAL01_13336 [Colletotrichum salicis]